jgi:hypothetical protein
MPTAHKSRLRDAVAVTVTTGRRLLLIGVAVLGAGQTIYLVQRIRGDVDSGWLGPLLLGNIALGLGRLYFDRKERQAG